MAVASMLRGAAIAAADLAHDTNRPQFHLLPAANWMNDPNGPIFWKGKYHMFFQYNPHAAVWGDMHWAHAVSPDMVHWQHLPVALAPTKGGPDGEGCFSGSAVVFNGVPTFLYTGVKSVSLPEATLSDGHNN
ncbi:MAG TPA: glycoside hydrolase family 32 protein, partial [Alloacidobacterium sp.]|nr:glycoside hydrolase family 32 protein [Alloacidobacterium sp.]